jgi:hypothetical protein
VAAMISAAAHPPRLAAKRCENDDIYPSRYPAALTAELARECRPEPSGRRGSPPACGRAPLSSFLEAFQRL